MFIRKRCFMNKFYCNICEEEIILQNGKCPKCKTVLRLPLKKGIHTCKCPTCHNKFEVKCKKNEKVKVKVIKGKS